MYLSRRRPGHTQALLEVEEKHEDDMRWLWLRMDKEGVRKDVASHTRQTTCVPRERTSRAPEPQKNPRARPPILPLSPSCLCAFTATIKLAELRALKCQLLVRRLPGNPPPESLAAWTLGS